MKYMIIALAVAFVSCGNSEETPKAWDEVIRDLDVDAEIVEPNEDEESNSSPEIVGDTTDQLIM